MALVIGDIIPEFSAKDSQGNLFESTSLIGIKPTVIYFYPKDDTPGCTAQACTFRDQYQVFKDLGAEVIGISGDSVTSHAKFTTKYSLPYILLSDSDKKIRKLFGVKLKLFGLIPGRVTYIIDKFGVIQLVFDDVSAKEHIPKALKTLRATIQQNS